MASKSQDLNEDVQICNLIKWLDDKYNTKLTEAFPSDFEEWFEMTGQLILTMYTYYLVDKSIIGKCLSYRLTENSQSTLMLGNIIKNVDNFFSDQCQTFAQRNTNPRSRQNIGTHQARLPF